MKNTEVTFHSDVFADTSGLAILLDPSEHQHQLAVSMYASILSQNRKLITTNYVIVELVALLQSPLRFSRSQILRNVHLIRVSPYYKIIHITPELDEAAWQLLNSRGDKNWSLCDAASFAAMSEMNLSDALTSDHHFDQAGFNRLLK